MFFTFQGFEVVTESENHDLVRDKHLKYVSTNNHEKHESNDDIF